MNPAHLVQHRVLRYLFSLIWLVNGIWCKVLGRVPRHEEIVGAILDNAVARPLTPAIGIAEIGMAAWILSGWRYRACATVQIAVILLMNVIEFFMVPHLLLWGQLNIVFAALLCGLIYWNAFPRKRETHA